MDSYNQRYDLGYADGYTHAEGNFDNAYRLHVEKSAGITAKQFNEDRRLSLGPGAARRYYIPNCMPPPLP
jgi:hypothetical protein